MEQIAVRDMLYLEDFDIARMLEECPEEYVGVNVNRIYVQITRFALNSERTRELGILTKALQRAQNQRTGIDCKYIPMQVKEIGLCFGQQKNMLKKLPKTSFVKL